MNERLSTYFECFIKQKEAGLIIVENIDNLVPIKDLIAQQGFAFTSSWQEIIAQLKIGTSVCLELPNALSKELYDLIAQYSAREGSIQIMHKDSMMLESIQFNPFKCHLLLLSSIQNIQEIEKTYSLKDKVGLVERI